MLPQSSDNYIKYYNLANQAKALYDQNEPKQALQKIKEAFGCVDYVHNEKLLLGSKIAVALKKYKLASTFLEQGFAQGVLLETVSDDSVYKQFKSTTYFKKLAQKYEELHGKYLRGINDYYSDQIDSLYYIDQFVIRSSTEKPKKVYNVVKHDHTTVINDSLIFVSFNDLVQKHGFPTERIVRRETLIGAYIILLHSVRLPRNQSYLVTLKKELEGGKFMPFYYAWTYDQALGISKKKPLYYCGVRYDKKSITASDLQEINRNRAEIGLENLVISE